jgi:hypothetical protein
MSAIIKNFLVCKRRQVVCLYVLLAILNMYCVTLYVTPEMTLNFEAIFHYSMRILNANSTDAQIFQKSRSHLKILDTRIVTRSQSHTEDPHILGVSLEKFSRTGDKNSCT